MKNPHRCDPERCVCPIHGTSLIYWPAGNEHACQDADCAFAHGLEKKLADLTAACRARGAVDDSLILVVVDEAPALLAAERLGVGDSWIKLDQVLAEARSRPAHPYPESR